MALVRLIGKNYRLARNEMSVSSNLELLILYYIQLSPVKFYLDRDQAYRRRNLNYKYKYQ